MNHWQRLGIEATRDKRAIKLAYTELLKQYPPAEFPDEFKALRKAYELATKEAKRPAPVINEWVDDEGDLDRYDLDQDGLDQDDIDEDNLNQARRERHGLVDSDFFDEEEPAPKPEPEPIAPAPVDLKTVASISELQTALNQLYFDKTLRDDASQWKLLLSAPLFWDIDQSQQVTFALMTFFSEHFLLSHGVLAVLDEGMKVTSELIVSKDLHCRELAVAFSHYIESLPTRMPSLVGVKDSVSFATLYQHLRLRNLIEEQCLYNKPSKEQLITLLNKVDPAFYHDEALYYYTMNYLWILGAYAEICDAFITLPALAKVDFAKLRDYQAHAAFKLGYYLQALSIYLAQRVRLKEQFGESMLKEIGACYLHLKDYEKAYVCLTQSMLEQQNALARIDVRIQLTIARRCYIKMLRENEQANALKIASLLYENSRYDAALAITQTYHQAFEDECNYLQALCLTKLGRTKEAYVVYLEYLEHCFAKQVDPWPITVDMVIDCPDLVDRRVIHGVIGKKVEPHPSKFYERARQLGSANSDVFSPSERAILDLPELGYDGELNQRAAYELYTETMYKQRCAWSLINILFTQLVKIDDPKMIKMLKEEAIRSIKQAMAILMYEPKLSTWFLNIAYDVDEFETCLQIIDIATKLYPDSPRNFYYKGRSLAALGQHEQAIEMLIKASERYGFKPLGVYALEFAVDSCNALVALGQPPHPMHAEILQHFHKTKEIVDAQSK